MQHFAKEFLVEKKKICFNLTFTNYHVSIHRNCFLAIFLASCFWTYLEYGALSPAHIGKPPCSLYIIFSCFSNRHCKLATLSRRQKPMLPGGRYLSMLPAGRQSLQFYNELIKWWSSANIFQCNAMLSSVTNCIDVQHTM